MTRAARKFIGPLTFESLTSHGVITELFPSHRFIETGHIQLSEWADCILICPATANIIGKIAGGIGDDFLSTVVLAAQCPVVIAPAMHSQMIQNPIVQDNFHKLKCMKIHVLPTEYGELASGDTGPGRLANNDLIIDELKNVLLHSDTLKSIKILITAGPSREFIDPVRFISNPSSGRMGFALAESAILRSSQVTLIHGKTDLRPFNGVTTVMVDSAEEMAKATEKEWKKHDVLIMAAAVVDYTPVRISKHKIKKDKDSIQLTLRRTPDIIQKAASHKGDRMVIGFALETRNGEENARKKLNEKGLDLICLNNLSERGVEFGSHTNKVTLIDKHGRKEEFPIMEKWEVAEVIMDRIEKELKKIKL